MCYRPFLSWFSASLLALTLAACAVGDASEPDEDSYEQGDDLVPSFGPESPSESASPGRGSGPDKDRQDEGGTSASGQRRDADPQDSGRSSGAESGADQDEASSQGSDAAAGPARPAAAVGDDRGDVSEPLGGTPAYVDLTGTRLAATKGGFELRVETAAVLPDRQRDDRKTMNVASFYDVDGDGMVDYEIWANLADNGWGPGYRDNRRKRAAFMGSSDVEVYPEAQTLVFRFPASHLGDATSFRWSVASEWGSYEVISTSASARDHAPDRGGVHFPG